MNKLAKLRKKKGLTQEAVGNALGISQAAVALWENGSSNPTIDKLKKLAELFECSVDELI